MDWGCTGLIHCVIMQHGSHSQSSRSGWQLITSENASPFKLEILCERLTLSLSYVTLKRSRAATLPWNTCQKTGRSSARCYKMSWNLKYPHLITTMTRLFEFTTSCCRSESVRNILQLETLHRRRTVWMSHRLQADSVLTKKLSSADQSCVLLREWESKLDTLRQIYVCCVFTPGFSILLLLLVFKEPLPSPTSQFRGTWFRNSTTLEWRWGSGTCSQVTTSWYRSGKQTGGAVNQSIWSDGSARSESFHPFATHHSVGVGSGDIFQTTVLKTVQCACLWTSDWGNL